METLLELCVLFIQLDNDQISKLEIPTETLVIELMKNIKFKIVNI